MSCLFKGRKAVKMIKTNYYKSSLVTNFVQTCTLTFIMSCIQYVVMIHHSEQVRLVEP